MDIFIKSLRGGMNDSDPSISLPDDQCVLAQNVEFNRSMLGERRKGSTAITLPASISSHERVPFLYRHLPSTDETAAELYVAGLTGTSSLTLSRKTTSWTDVTVIDTPNLTGFYPYQWAAASIHNKLFLAYKSGSDRLHIVEGTTMRRAGLAEPAAPTGANSGSGTYTGTRYIRVRYVTVSGSTVLLRSEPSDTLTFAPSGSGTGVTVTRPALISEGETHWEVEFSVDNANFYRLSDSRVAVATTTYVDTTAYSSGYATLTGAVLSEDIGDYALLPSARYLTVDEDRLIYGGSWEVAALASRVGWTPVYGADGVGNDERSETDTTPYKDLDGLEGGPLTGLSAPVVGSVWAFKLGHIYKLVRSGRRTNAYEAMAYTKKRGALHGSVVEGVDHAGQPVLFFLDPLVGPCMLGPEGLLTAGRDIRETWKTVNIDATKVVCSGLFYPENQQVHWCIATSGANVPNKRIVLHTRNIRHSGGIEALSGGWAIWTGNTSGALAQCLFSENIEDGTARNRVLRPFVGLEGNGLVHRMDTADDDNGTEYSSRIVTKPYIIYGLMKKFGIASATMLAKAISGASVVMTAIRDFGLEEPVTKTITFTATGSETDVIKHIDDFSCAELDVVQIELEDPGTPGPRWELNLLVLKERDEQSRYHETR